MPASPVPNSDGNFGRLDAIKLADRTQAWSVRQRAPMTSAVLPTAGGVVFAGSLDRWFRAYDDTTGKVLWEGAHQQRGQRLPDQLQRRRQAICRGRGRQRLDRNCARSTR